MTAASCSPAVASRRAKYDGDFRVPTLLDAQPLSIFNIDMAIEPEKGGKLAHERLQSALPVRAKTRRKPSRLMGPQGCSAGATPAVANGHCSFTGGSRQAAVQLPQSQREALEQILRGSKTAKCIATAIGGADTNTEQSRAIWLIPTCKI